MSKRKDKTDIAERVISGEFGSGAKLKIALNQMGYKYNDIMKVVSSIKRREKAENEDIEADIRATKLAIAEDFNPELSGMYVINSDKPVNMRMVPSDKNRDSIITALRPKAKVRCSGYFSIKDGIKWMLCSTPMVSGFVNEKYLSRI